MLEETKKKKEQIDHYFIMTFCEWVHENDENYDMTKI